METLHSMADDQWRLACGPEWEQKKYAKQRRRVLLKMAALCERAAEEE
jgi:hypothetical protein